MLAFEVAKRLNRKAARECPRLWNASIAVPQNGNLQNGGTESVNRVDTLRTGDERDPTRSNRSRMFDHTQQRWMLNRHTRLWCYAEPTSHFSASGRLKPRSHSVPFTGIPCIRADQEAVFTRPGKKKSEKEIDNALPVQADRVSDFQLLGCLLLTRLI